MFAFDPKSLDAMKASIKAYAGTIENEVAIEGAAGMALVIYEEAKSNAARNKKSGLLESAIYRVYSPEKSTPAVKIYRISWNKKKAPHGHLIEFGTSTAPAYPFLGPARSRIPDAITAGQARMTKKLTDIKGKP